MTRMLDLPHWGVIFWHQPTRDRERRIPQGDFLRGARGLLVASNRLCGWTQLPTEKPKQGLDAVQRYNEPANYFSFDTNARAGIVTQRTRYRHQVDLPRQLCKSPK